MGDARVEELIRKSIFKEKCFSKLHGGNSVETNIRIGGDYGYQK